MISALEWAARTAWAMDPTYLNKMFAVLYRHASGTRLSAEEIAVATGRPKADVYDEFDGKKTKEEPPPYQMSKGGVATVSITGVIAKRAASVNNISGPSGSSCETIRANIQAALDDSKVKKIVLDVDSPGGSVDGVADLSDWIHSKRGLKPMLAYANGQMASAAYFIASSADRIVTSQDAAVGSIGVYSILQDWSMYLKNCGVNEEMIKAGKYKGLGHPDFPITAETRKVAQDEVNAHYDNFVAAIARNRGMTIEEATKVADGRCHIGDEACSIGLADEVGTLDSIMSGAIPAENPQPDSPKKIKPVTGEAPEKQVATEATLPIRVQMRDRVASIADTAHDVIQVRFPDSRPCGRGLLVRMKT